MANLGIQPHVIEEILNHKTGTRSALSRIYNRASYEIEKRRALELWAAHVTDIVEGRTSSVVPLRRA
jgi:hypothetical protein